MAHTITLKRGINMWNSKCNQQRCWSCYNFNIVLTKFYQYISLKPQTISMWEFWGYLSSPAEADPSGAEGRIHNTNRILPLSTAVVTMAFHIKMTMQAYEYDHSLVYIFVPVLFLINLLLFQVIIFCIFCF